MKKKKKKIVPKLRQEVKVKGNIVTSDDIQIYYTGKFQDFTARYIIMCSFILHYSEGQNGTPEEDGYCDLTIAQKL